MKVLVANLGSTSFKYRLFDLPSEVQLARGGIDRIGQAESHCFVEIGEHHAEMQREIPDHRAAVQICLDQLTDEKSGCLSSVEEVAAIGFKAVFAGSLSGVRRVNLELLSRMQQLSDIAPAHNPPYAKAMRELMLAFPHIPLVAALETGFHDTIPEAHRSYAVQTSWRDDYEIQRWGFHGASHRYLSSRIAEIKQQNHLKVVTCHLGGSSSLCAIDSGKSIATSMGMSPQTGLPQNNRVGDFDPFAIPVLMRARGVSLEELLEELSNQSGLLGLSGISGDIRDLEKAASEGHERAQLALDVYTSSIRQYLGGYLALLGGADVILFSGGIGENSQYVRRKVCERMEWANLHFDEEKNQQVSGEMRISTDDSPVEVWVIPTNEEIVVARQTVDLIESGN